MWCNYHFKDGTFGNKWWWQLIAAHHKVLYPSPSRLFFYVFLFVSCSYQTVGIVLFPVMFKYLGGEFYCILIFSFVHLKLHSPQSSWLTFNWCICLVFAGQMKKIKRCPFRDLKARIAQALPFGTLSALLIFSSDLFDPKWFLSICPLCGFL